MNDENKSVTWKATLIGAAMTIASSTAGYVSSHWGGTTRDELKESASNLEDKLGKRIDHAVAKVGDEMKAYVDERVGSAEDRLAIKPKKKKRSNAEP